MYLTWNGSLINDVIMLENDAEDREKLGEMNSEAGGIRINGSKVSTVSANLTECDSLANAFEGCRGVFHTSSFIDPTGLTGYSVRIFL